MSDTNSEFGDHTADNEPRDARLPWVGPTTADVNAAFPDYDVESLVVQEDDTAIYRAVQTNLSRTVQLRILSPLMSSDPNVTEQFRQRTAARSQKDTTVHDCGRVSLPDSSECFFLIEDHKADNTPVSTATSGSFNLPLSGVMMTLLIASGLVALFVNSQPPESESRKLPDSQSALEISPPGEPANSADLPKEIVVTSLVDGVDTPGSLRLALQKAVDGDTITFSPQLSGGTLKLVEGPLTFTSSATIDGGSLAKRITIDGQGDSGVLRIDKGRQVEFRNLKITGGSSNDGGGIHIYEASAKLFSCVVANNRAERWGGGIYAWNGHLEAECCVIAGNTAEKGGGFANFGGGFYLRNCVVVGNTSRGGRCGASMNVNYGTMNLVHCTVTGNRGGGMETHWEARLTIESTIVWGNEGKHGDVQVWKHDGPGFNTRGVNIVGDLQADVKSGPTPLSAAPMFQEELFQSQRLPVPTPGSPAIDIAVVSELTPQTDIRGAPRPLRSAPENDRPDLGAVEYSGSTAEHR